MFRILMLMLVACVTFFQNYAFAIGAKENAYSPDLYSITKQTEIHVFPVTARNGITDDEVKVINEQLVNQLKKLGYPVSYHVPSYEDNADYYVFDLSEENPVFSRPESWYGNFIVNFGKPGIYVVPTVIKRRATLNGKLAKWDGARQELRLHGSDLGMWSGEMSAYSIRLEVFDDKPSWLMLTYGGISIPVEAHLRNRELVRKENLFSHRKDYKALIRGIDKAIWPFKVQFKVK